MGLVIGWEGDWALTYGEGVWVLRPGSDADLGGVEFLVLL